MTKELRIELYQHQINALEAVKDKPNCGLFLDLGLGKSITGICQAFIYDNPMTILVCPKSIIEQWKDTFRQFFPQLNVVDLTKCKKIEPFEGYGLINYDLLWRRPELLNMRNYTLILDESSKISHDDSKRTKFILKMKPTNTILLSGSPCGGKYENMYTTAKLLGLSYNKRQWWDNFVRYNTQIFGGNYVKMVYGYKNIDRMIEELKNHGAVFMKSKDVLGDLPDRLEQTITIAPPKEYKQFLKNRITVVGGEEWVGDTALTLRLRARMLCGSYNDDKLKRVEELLIETDERVIIYYSFVRDYQKLCEICEKLDKPVAYANGDGTDLANYEKYDNCVILCQYSSASYGLNLQKAAHLIHFSLTESCDLFMQSEGRITRIGQLSDYCKFYYMISKGTVEEGVLKALKRGEDYNNDMFEKYLESYR